MKVVLTKSDAVEPFSFRFTDDDGKTLLRSENYKARASAKNGILSVKKNASSEKRYERKTAKNAKLFFNLKATNGQVIGTSSMFADEQQREAVIELLSKEAADAQIDDQSQARAVTAKSSAKETRPEAVTKAVQEPEQISATGASTSQETGSKQIVTDIATDQLDATSARIVSALSTLESQIAQARESGSSRGKQIVNGIGGDGKMSELIEELAGYLGEAASAGVTVGSTPMIVMAGTVKGIYRKVIE